MNDERVWESSGNEEAAKTWECDLFSNLNCLESDFAEFLIKELGAWLLGE